MQISLHFSSRASKTSPLSSCRQVAAPTDWTHVPAARMQQKPGIVPADFGGVPSRCSSAAAAPEAAIDDTGTLDAGEDEEEATGGGVTGVSVIGLRKKRMARRTATTHTATSTMPITIPRFMAGSIPERSARSIVFHPGFAIIHVRERLSGPLSALIGIRDRALVSAATHACFRRQCTECKHT